MDDEGAGWVVGGEEVAHQSGGMRRVGARRVPVVGEALEAEGVGESVGEVEVVVEFGEGLAVGGEALGLGAWAEAAVVGHLGGEVGPGGGGGDIRSVGRELEREG